MRLALKRFRGEPAISWFVWHFTPYHSSSANFATLVGAGLHGILLPLHPGHGKLTRFRVYPLPLSALFRLAFAPAPGVPPLTLRQRVTRRFILQKARGQAFPLRGIALPQLVGTRFQVLFHSPLRGAFHLSLTVLVRYRSRWVFSLGWWSTRFPTGFHVPRGTHELARSPRSFAYRTVTLFGGPFQWPSTRARFSNSVTLLRQHLASRTTPNPQRPQAITRIRFRLFRFRSPLLTEYSLFLQVLRCFSSLAYLRHAYLFSVR